MSSFSIVCSLDSRAAIGDSMHRFELWLAGAFPEARVVGRSGTGVNALEWVIGDYDSAEWMDGSINESRTAIYLRGAPDLMAATAMAVRELFPDESPVTYTEDWQGIVFDLRKFSHAAALVDAVNADDAAFEWREDADGHEDRMVERDSSDWVCSKCGDSLRCSSCMSRRPAHSPEDRATVASALEQQAATRQVEKRHTLEPPSTLSDAIHIVVSGAILLAHVALVALGVYGAWYEFTNWDGGVAFAGVLAALIGVYGAWRSAEGLVSRTWQAVRVLTVTVPATGLLVIVLPLLTWSRSGP